MKASMSWIHAAGTFRLYVSSGVRGRRRGQNVSGGSLVHALSQIRRQDHGDSPLLFTRSASYSVSIVPAYLGSGRESAV